MAWLPEDAAGTMGRRKRKRITLKRQEGDV